MHHQAGTARHLDFSRGSPNNRRSPPSSSTHFVLFASFVDPTHLALHGCWTPRFASHFAQSYIVRDQGEIDRCVRRLGERQFYFSRFEGADFLRSKAKLVAGGPSARDQSFDGHTRDPRENPISAGSNGDIVA